MSETCPACDGFLVATPAFCPHCGITLTVETPTAPPPGEDAAGAPSPGAETREPETILPPPEPVFQDLVLVYQGPTTDVMALQVALAAEGHETFIRDQMTKTIDPFITGANCLNLTLHASADRAQAVAAAIHRIQARRQGGKAGTGIDPGDPEAALELELMRQGSRVCFAGILVILAPLGLYFGIKYMNRVNRTGHRPANHGFFVGMIWLCLLETLALVWFLPQYFQDTLPA